MTGRLLEAEEAHRLGLINHLVAEAELLPKAREVAAALASKPPVAWARTKARFRQVAMAGFEEAFRAAVEGQQEAFARGEPQAIMDAFLERRGGKPGA